MRKLVADELGGLNTATICHICDLPFNNDSSNIKVQDHCHIIGDCKGACHQECNVNYFILTLKLKITL